ncbi:hypothetical protein [Salicibibacter kimchii]|uniref:hypothetical protein n=1 Tax=Salicibibacter kimchii TaxID=2099786 RepID=UPI001D03D06F|nr:hypothetical protein [Salicibibacter kimchii]
MTSAMPVIVQEESAPYLDHDGLWKKVITDLFEPFIVFIQNHRQFRAPQNQTVKIFFCDHTINDFQERILRVLFYDAVFQFIYDSLV